MEKDTRHFATLISLMVGTLLLTYLPNYTDTNTSEAMPNHVSIDDYSKIPYSINGWQGRDVQIDENAFTILQRDADQWLVREYRRGTERMILSLVSTVDQRKLFRVHIPDICLPAQGWTIIARSTHKLALGDTSPFLTTKLLAHKGTTDTQVLYWFTSSNRIAESKFFHRLLLVWDGITGARTAGTLVQVTTPLENQDPEDLLHLQEEFLALMHPFFSEKVPAG